MNVKELSDGFLGNCKDIGMSAATIVHHEGRIRRFILPALGDLDVSELLPIHGDKVLKKGTEASYETGRRCVITLRSIIKYARKNGVKFPFDIDDIMIPPARRVKDSRALSTQDISDVRAYFQKPMVFSKHARGHTQAKALAALIRTKALFEFLLHTGLRISEALSVDRENVDFENHEVRFISKKTKRWETVYLFGAEKELKEYMATRKDDIPALFICGNNKRLCPISAQTYLQAIKKRVGLKKNLSHHIFRSTFVTTLLRNKVDPRKTQLLARHTSLQTTLLYYYEVEKEELKPIHKEVMSLI
jgi:site-specific recombinase XerD